LSSEKASVSIKKSCFEKLPKNWTEDEGALTPTFFSKEVWYNAGRETSAWGGHQGQGSGGGSAPASGVSEVKTAAANGPNALVAIPDASKAMNRARVRKGTFWFLLVL